MKPTRQQTIEAAQPQFRARTGPPREAGSVQSARARLDEAKAEAQEMANRLRRGELVERDDMRRANAEFGAILKNELRGLGNALAPDLAHQTPAEVKAILDRRMDEMLTRIADKLGEP